MVKELLSHEFTERLLPIFLHIEQETGISGRNNPKHFFPAWQRMMEIGVARAWENDGCVLGALFTPELYSGKMQAHVIFWFSLPEARGTGRPQELLAACEDAARKAGAFKLSSSAHVQSNPISATRSYLKRGYKLSEELFTLAL